MDEQLFYERFLGVRVKLGSCAATFSLRMEHQ